MDVSVVIPCHNGQPYLAQAIRSVLAQTAPPAEVILIDDASTDDSAAIGRSFGSRVRVESKQFRNAARARNFGASLTRGDALMFLDSDDVLGPDVLEALASEVGRHPHSVAACPWYRLELQNGRWIRQPPSCAPRSPGQDPLEAWLRGWYHPPASVLWSGTALEMVGDWDPRAGPNDDGELMMRALVLGVPLRLISHGAAFYRRMPEGASSLSGTRFSEPGLRARIYVIAKVARMLEAIGRLDPHRPAVGYAFSRILWDCEAEYPELAQDCRAHRRRYGEPAWRRIGRNLIRRGLAAIDRAADRGTAARHRPDEQEPQEVKYGLKEGP